MIWPLYYHTGDYASACTFLKEQIFKVGSIVEKRDLEGKEDDQRFFCIDDVRCAISKIWNIR